MLAKIQFWGAAGTVTGSCYHVTMGSSNFIVDCGMFQGPEVEQHNFDKWGFDASKVDFMLLTHAHLDHVGLIPKLIKQGFRGPIYSTLNTAQIAQIIMLDSAKIQENNFSRGVPWEFTGRIEMIYNNSHVMQAISQFSPVKFYEQFTPVNKTGAELSDIKITAIPSAHVLGAGSFEITSQGKTVVFSGDIGRVQQPLIDQYPLDYKKEVDYVVMESLYGGILHPDRRESVNEFISLIREVTNQGGNVFIPSFAVQRTQEILNDIKHAKSGGALKTDLLVWLDSPMSMAVTTLYANELDSDVDSAFTFPGLMFSKSGKQSAKITRRPGQVIIAGSGMASGGRIVGHLARGLNNKKNAVIFVGYQAEATLGRELVDGAKTVTIEDVQVQVKAGVYYMSGFSAHGDDSDLKTWLSRYNSSKLQKVVLVHAEPERAQTFKTELGTLGYKNIHVPTRESILELE